MESRTAKDPATRRGSGGRILRTMTAGGSGTHRINGNESGLEEQGSWWAIPKPEPRRTATAATRPIELTGRTAPAPAPAD